MVKEDGSVATKVLVCDFSSDYKEALNDVIEDLERSAGDMSTEERTKASDSIVESYVEQTGERPDSSALSRLANVILRDDLTSRTKEEIKDAPFLSDTQYERRVTGRNDRKRPEGFRFKEVPMLHASNVAVDGGNYTMPIRSFSNPF